MPSENGDLESYKRFCARASSKGVNPDTRPSVYGIQRYRKVTETGRPWMVFALRTLDGRGSYRVDWREAMHVAAWVRHAAGLALLEEGWPRERVNSYVLGHAEDPSAGSDRLSYLPLPSIGHEHADGGVRRVAIVEPVGRATDALRLLGLKLPVIPLTDERSRTICRLARPADEKVSAFYRRKARTWTSVTPVILHGHNTMRGTLSLPKTERLLLQAFEAGGFPSGNIDSMTFQPAPYWAGCERAGTVRVPRHLDNRPRYHVAVEFREAVEGPVVAGIGRHYGLGLFASGGD